MENLNNPRTGQNNQSSHLTNEESDFVRSDDNSGQSELNLYGNDTQDEQIYNENNANNVSHNNPNENSEDRDENLDTDEEEDDFENEEDEEDENLSDDDQSLDNERQNRSYHSPSDDYENKIDQSFSGSL